MNFFLNTDKRLLPSAPANTFVHIGNGTNMVYVDPEKDVVAVARWINGGAMDGFVVTNNPGGARAMGYYTESDLPLAYWLAGTFATGDRYFCSLLGPTWPNRYYLY